MQTEGDGGGVERWEGSEAERFTRDNAQQSRHHSPRVENREPDGCERIPFGSVAVLLIESMTGHQVSPPDRAARC